MKNTMIVSISIFILLMIAIGIGGFIVFNKRLAESKLNKESGEISTERNIQADVLESKEKMTVGENSLQLQIISPSDQSTVTSAYITLRGKTISGAEVFINDKETIADVNGDFSVSLTLEEGDNPIMAVANDQEGNVGEAEITVYYETAE
jgi:hypothetical protein